MPWTDTLSNEDRAHAATKGWDRLDDAAAALAISKSYRELERIRPAPAEVPKTAAEYKFNFGEGKNVDGEFVDFARGLALDLKLPVDAANTLATRLLTWGEAAEAAEATANAANLAAGQERLKSAWGAEYDNKTVVAARALEAMNLSKEIVDAIGAQIGVDKLMDTAYTLGTRMGEAPLLKGENVVDTPQTTMTRGDALKRRNELSTDAGFYKKYMEGDKEAVAEMDRVIKAIVGTPDNWQPAPAGFGREHDDFGKEKEVDYAKFNQPAPAAKP